RVLEVVPGGYELENQTDGGDIGAVAPENGQYNFTNRRTGTVTLQVTKQWVGDSESDRPDNVTLKLERKPVTGTSWTDITHEVARPQWIKGENTWTLTYTGLLQYDESGVRYQYRVTEDG